MYWYGVERARSAVSNSLWPHSWTAARQAPQSMAFSRQEYWSGLPSLTSGAFLTWGLRPRLSCLPPWQADFQGLPDPSTAPAPLASPALAGGFLSLSHHSCAKSCDGVTMTHQGVCPHESSRRRPGTLGAQRWADRANRTLHGGHFATSKASEPEAPRQLGFLPQGPRVHPGPELTRCSSCCCLRVSYSRAGAGSWAMALCVSVSHGQSSSYVSQNWLTRDCARSSCRYLSEFTWQMVS